MNISKPPRHPWKPLKYQHVMPAPKTSPWTAMGQAAGNIINAIRQIATSMNNTITKTNKTGKHTHTPTQHGARR